MSMVIAHNLPALQTYNIVNNTSNALQKSIAKLSSGLRINSAADDAAGLAISEKMRSQVRGLDRAVANTQDGISMIQTAEGALGETHSILQRMRELSVQAANDTLTQQDRSYIQEEIDQLKEEVTRIGNTTQFNKKKLLNGDSSALWSSDNLETKALIRGGLRDVDQFGQKKSVEGNYKITVKAEPGQGEVQKSDIMKIKHPNVLTDKTINVADGVKDVEVDSLTPGTYKLQLETSQDAKGTASLTGYYGLGGKEYSAETTLTITPDGTSPTASSFDIMLGGTKIGTASAAANGNLTVNESALANEAAKQGVTLTMTGGDGTAATATFTLKKLNGEPAALTVSAPTSGNATGAFNTPTKSDSEVKATEIFTVAAGANNIKNASILFEVTGKDDANGTVTLKATASTLSQHGDVATESLDNIVLTQGTTEFDLSGLLGGKSGDNLASVKLEAGKLAAVDDDAKFVYFINPKKADDDTDAADAVNIDLTGSIDGDWEDTWTGGTFNNQTLSYFMDSADLTNTETHFDNFIINGKTGTVSKGTINLISNKDMTNATLTTTQDAGGKTALDRQDVLASFTSSYIGKVASGDVKLRDLDKFWNSEGTFMLDDAKTLTLNQGNGQSASVTLYANDTLDDVATKINDAIATGLGQSKYVNDATKFATFVEADTGNSESVPGTFVIRSVVPGAAGEITFSGDQGIIDAFSLNTIQDSKETRYNVDVTDAHSGKIIAQNVKTTGNVLHGVIHENVDVEFSALGGINATWNSDLNKFTYDSVSKETTLHLADNTTVLQIGANEGEDLAMDIGDMRAHALGLDGVNVMSHDRAGRSITIIDNAIDRVSTQRAKLGAYQNRLEYTASNLTTASENLTSAESRIRDADMAKEMMEFTKLNIMLQAGNSMLAQANQQPQNVLSLIR